MIELHFGPLGIDIIKTFVDDYLIRIEWEYYKPSLEPDFDGLGKGVLIIGGKNI